MFTVADHTGRSFLVETEDRPRCALWDMDFHCAEHSMGVYCDYLDDHNCSDEAELTRLEWGAKLGRHIQGAKEAKRVAELKAQFKIQDTRIITRPVSTTALRPRLARLFLENTCGNYHLKATVQLNEIHLFLDILHAHPIVELVLVAEPNPIVRGRVTLGQRSSNHLIIQQLQMYLKYTWFRKIFKLELNGFGLEFLTTRNLFTNTELFPRELRVTGRDLIPPTPAQARILPLIVPNLRWLWKLTYGTYTHEYQ